MTLCHNEYMVSELLPCRHAAAGYCVCPKQHKGFSEMTNQRKPWPHGKEGNDVTHPLCVCSTDFWGHGIEKGAPAFFCSNRTWTPHICTMNFSSIFAGLFQDTQRAWESCQPAPTQWQLWYTHSLPLTTARSVAGLNPLNICRLGGQHHWPVSPLADTLHRLVIPLLDILSPCKTEYFYYLSVHTNENTPCQHPPSRIEALVSKTPPQHPSRYWITVWRPSRCCWTHGPENFSYKHKVSKGTWCFKKALGWR